MNVSAGNNSKLFAVAADIRSHKVIQMCSGSKSLLGTPALHHSISNTRHLSLIIYCYELANCLAWLIILEKPLSYYLHHNLAETFSRQQQLLPDMPLHPPTLVYCWKTHTRNAQTILCNENDNNYYYIRLTAFFSKTALVSRHQKGKPFWILLQQEMTGWQWHQLDHMQIICTCSRQITKQVSHHSVFTGQMPFVPPNQQPQSIEGKVMKMTRTTKSHLQAIWQ